MKIKKTFKVTIKCVEPEDIQKNIDWWGRLRPAIKVDGQHVLQPAEFATTRHVYEYERGGQPYIIKVADPWSWHRIGRQTEAEIKMWLKMDEEDRQHFVPLVSWGKTKEDRLPFVIQPRIEWETPQVSDKEVSNLFKVLGKYRTRDIEIDDYREYDEGWDVINAMMYCGTLRVYDWGINQYTKDLRGVNDDGKYSYSFQRS